MKKAVAVVLAFACLVLGTREAGASHGSTGTIFPAGWQERDVYLYFSGASWSQIGNIADRMLNGAGQYTNRTGADFRFWNAGNRTLSVSACNGQNENGLFWVNLGGQPPPGYKDVIGRTTACTHGGAPWRMYSFRTEVDGAQPNWYTDTGAAPANTYDLFSLATHELGHGAGFFSTNQKHWDDVGPDSELQCVSGTSSSKHSLCASVPTGTTMMRSLATHDLESFTARY